MRYVLRVTSTHEDDDHEVRVFDSLPRCSLHVAEVYSPFETTFWQRLHNVSGQKRWFMDFDGPYGNTVTRWHAEVTEV